MAAPPTSTPTPLPGLRLPVARRRLGGGGGRGGAGRRGGGGTARRGDRRRGRRGAWNGTRRRLHCSRPTPAGASLASEVRVPRADGGAVLGGCRRESDAGGGRAGSAGRALSTAVRGPDDGDPVLPGAQERAAGRERLLHPLLTR